jgi:NAD(P)-dependent dehydrogenase (short-subunit alcohol dehydrogenase family)
MVYTPMMYAGGMTDEAREARKNRSLLKTEGTGWDVGAAVRFLAGDEARWMTGMIHPFCVSRVESLTDWIDNRSDITC